MNVARSRKKTAQNYSQPFFRRVVVNCYVEYSAKKSWFSTKPRCVSDKIKMWPYKLLWSADSKSHASVERCHFQNALPTDAASRGLLVTVQLLAKLTHISAVTSGVARNLIWGVYVLTSHCNLKTCVNVPHVNKTVTDFGGIYTEIPSVATPLAVTRFRLPVPWIAAWRI